MMFKTFDLISWTWETEHPLLSPKPPRCIKQDQWEGYVANSNHACTWYDFSGLAGTLSTAGAPTPPTSHPRVPSLPPLFEPATQLGHCSPASVHNMDIIDHRYARGQILSLDPPNWLGMGLAGLEVKTNEWTTSTNCEWGKQRTCQQALLWKQENPTCTRCKHFRVPACYIFINTRHICHLVRVTQFYVESVWWEAEIDSCDHVLNEWCTYHI